MEMIITAITGSYLAIMAVIDRRRKEIPVLPGVLCLILLVRAQFVDCKGWLSWLPGMLIGLFLYIVSKISDGAIGEGDALVYFLTGVALGFFRNLELLICSLFLSSLVSGFLLVFRRVGKKERIPLVPFTALAYGMVMLL